MLFAHVTVKQDGAILALNNFQNAFKTTEILDEVGALLLNRIRTRFLSEIDPQGIPWVPSQAGIRRRKAGGSGTLFDTGNLFRSIQLHITGEDERTISTDVPYARALQEGDGRMPARIFLGFGGEDATLVEKLLQLRADKLFK